MVGLPPREELVGLVGLVVGVVLFVYGVVLYTSAGAGGGRLLLVVVGGLLGLAAVGYLYVYYRLIRIATGH